MSKSLSIDIKTAEKLVAEIESFEEVKRHILQLIPEGVIPYGSKLWWEKEMFSGEEAIKKGDYTIKYESKITHDDIPVFSFAPLNKIKKDLLDQGYSIEEAKSTILGLSELPEYASNKGNKKSSI